MLACLISMPLAGQQRGRLLPQPRSIWGSTDVTVYRGSPKYPSLSGEHYLIYQPDGNLVVHTKSGQFVWGLNEVTDNFGSAQSITFARGNIVARDGAGAVVWQALAAVDRVGEGARPELTPDGVLRMAYCLHGGDAKTGGIFWASDKKTRRGCDPSPASASAPAAGNAAAPPAAAPAPAPANAKAPENALPFAAALPMKAGTSLQRDRKYRSRSGNHTLVFAKDGNLVITRTRDESFHWGLADVARNYDRSDRVELRPDGSFVVVDAKGGVVWTAPQKQKDPAATLTVTFSGALQVVVPGGEILWSSDGILTPPIDITQKANTTPCVPKDEGAPEWHKCIKMAEPAMIIFGSRMATPKAMNAVANVYAELTSRFRPAYPKSKLDGFKVFLTNGETGATLKQLPPAGTMWKDATGPKSGDFLQGGASDDYLWITEQMICKEGVKSRNANYAALGMDKPDHDLRMFDQVIHELGHSLFFRYKIGDDSEEWPWAIQHWFASPVGEPERRLAGNLPRLFTSKASFSCENY